VRTLVEAVDIAGDPRGESEDEQHRASHNGETEVLLALGELIAERTQELVNRRGG
jgi:hypothetical protein